MPLGSMPNWRAKTPPSVDLKKFIGDLVAVSQDFGRDKKQSRSSSRPAKLPQGAKGFFVQGHDIRLGQVITNLIENARSFVPDDTGRIVISLERAGKFNVVTVDDNGPGIRADNIDRIFERFYTDRPSSEAFGQNSGLGLSISRQIVEAHGGTLSAENIPGTKPGDIRGARFVAAFPAEVVSATAGNIHATALVVIGDRGIMIVGRSGSGKTRLPWRFDRSGAACGRFASPGCGRSGVPANLATVASVARAPEAIAGLIEVRGLGPAPIAHDTSTSSILWCPSWPRQTRRGSRTSKLMNAEASSVPLLTLPKGNTQGALRPIAAWLRLPPFC